MELIKELAGTDKSSIEKQNRLKEAKDSFNYFCRYYLSDYFYADPAEYQKILYEVANTRSLTQKVADSLKPFVRDKYHNLLKPTQKLSGAIFCEPREHGKTVRFSFAYVLWSVLTGRAKYVLLIGASGDSARENLQNIKTEIEENEKILEDFGSLQGDTWTNVRLELTNGTCIQAKGSGASMRGTRFRQYRPDLIVIDDVLKDDAINSPSQRNKIHRWLKRVVFNLGKTAFIIWVNTVFHNDDPVSRLCRELEAGDLVNWIAVRLGCIRPDGTPLWPEYWDIQSLEDKKKTIGVSAFSTEYMNEPLADEERIIHIEWIEEHNIRNFRQETVCSSSWAWTQPQVHTTAQQKFQSQGTRRRALFMYFRRSQTLAAKQQPFSRWKSCTRLTILPQSAGKMSYSLESTESTSRSWELKKAYISRLP